MNFTFCQAWCLLLALVAATPASAVELGIRDGRFLVDGYPAFLVGVSYYGALGADEVVIRRDLDELGRRGFRWVRVWATWNAFGHDVSAIDGGGRPRQPYLARLVRLVEECNRRGLVVDVTLARGSGAFGALQLSTLDGHRRAVETLIAALKGHRNWYLDLANERNIGDERFVSIDELRDLRSTARRLFPSLLVTASHGGDIDREALREYVNVVGVDFVAPHRPRDRGSAERTPGKTRELLAWMQGLGRIVPVHYQEPFRRGYASWQPSLDDFLRDVAGAREGGAAGWCFHNGDTRTSADGRPGRSFDLSRQGLFDQLDEVERRVIDRVASPERMDERHVIYLRGTARPHPRGERRDAGAVSDGFLHRPPPRGSALWQIGPGDPEPGSPGAARRRRRILGSFRGMLQTWIAQMFFARAGVEFPSRC